MSRARSGVAFLIVLAFLAAPVTAQGAGPVILRYPYLTDVSGSWAMLNLATDTPSPAPVVSWGPASGDCVNPPNSVTATYVTAFGTVDRQFKAQLTGLQANTAYCYRVSQAGVDLLGSAPVFTSALASGATDPFTFAVLGDWGAGTSDESKVIGQIALAQPSFVVTVGDNVYNSGTQTEYGDINGGNAFGPQYWPQIGRTTPVFPAEGNHGFSGSLPYFQNWPMDSTVAACAAAGCKYTRETYCCVSVLGTNVKSYPSAWYAFDWGNSRFYILEGAWSDSYGAYLGDFQARFNGPVAGCTPCGTELTWLSNDLAAHSGAHKFAFFHYPLYSDNSSQNTDSYLDGPNGLEGLLAANGVHIVFNGHAHDYERNYPQIPGSPMLSYITGGGGDPLGGVSGHSAFDAYAKVVYEYLKVSVSGANVTVTPIDENGATFDVQTYTFAPPSGGNDFSISASPGSVSVNPGQGASSTINTAVVSGNSQNVTLGAGGLPAGTTASFSPTSVTSGGASTLTLTTSSSTPPGSYPITVTGTGTSASHSTTVTLTVLSPDDFSISASPGSVSVNPGQGATATISTAVVSGNPQTVTFSASGMPAGVSASFSPTSVTSGGSSTLTMTTGASTPAGSYPITVTGAGSSVSHTTTVTLTVIAPDDFLISASPASISVVQGQSGSSTVSTTVISGSPQPVSLSAAGLPAGATATFSPASVTAGGSSTMTISTAASTLSGAYTVTVTGAGTSATHTTSISLTVASPSSGPAFVQAAGASETASATSLTATFAGPTTRGDLLVLTASVYTGTTNPIQRVTDSAGNTWTKVGAYCTASHNSDGEVWYAANASPATTVTVYVSSATTVAVEIMEFAGVAALTPVDTSAGASNTGTTAASGTATPTASTDLAIGFVAGHASSQTITVTAAGFTTQGQQTSSNAGSTPVSIVSGYQVLSSAAAQNFSGSYTSAMYWAAGIVLFKSA